MCAFQLLNNLCRILFTDGFGLVKDWAEMPQEAATESVFCHVVDERLLWGAGVGASFVSKKGRVLPVVLANRVLVLNALLVCFSGALYQARGAAAAKGAGLREKAFESLSLSRLCEGS